MLTSAFNHLLCYKFALIGVFFFVVVNRLGENKVRKMDDVLAELRKASMPQPKAAAKGMRCSLLC